jgi:triosephosphate isomerase
MINDVIAGLGGPARAVLYGGSVNPANAAELLSDHNTHGLFVGRAAWEASGFIELLKLCASLDGAEAGSSTTHSRTLPGTTTAVVL